MSCDIFRQTWRAAPIQWKAGHWRDLRNPDGIQAGVFAGNEQVAICWHPSETDMRTADRIATLPELIEVLAEYVVLGPGRCNISKEHVSKAAAILKRAQGRS